MKISLIDIAPCGIFPIIGVRHLYLAVTVDSLRLTGILDYADDEQCLS
jgi:hypothetical protein